MATCSSATKIAIRTKAHNSVAETQSLVMLRKQIRRVAQHQTNKAIFRGIPTVVSLSFCITHHMRVQLLPTPPEVPPN